MSSLPTDPDPQTSLPGVRRWQQALLLSVRLRQAASLLLVLYASALLVSALPLRLLDPRWYLNATDVLMANAPIAITAACLGLFSQVLSPLQGKKAWLRSRLRFQRFCGLMALLYLAILPIQLLASGPFVLELNRAERTRLQTLQSQQQRIIERISTARSLADLNALLPPPPGQAAGSLAQRQASIRQALTNDEHALRRQLRHQRHQRLLALSLNGLRILLTALATALFFRLLARPSDQLLAQMRRDLG